VSREATAFCNKLDGAVEMKFWKHLRSYCLFVGIVAVSVFVVNRLFVKPRAVSVVEKRLDTLIKPTRAVVHQTISQLGHCSRPALIKPPGTILAYEIWDMTNGCQLIVYYESGDWSDRDREMLSFRSVSMRERVSSLFAPEIKLEIED
jgi:hypothetical protein